MNSEIRNYNKMKNMLFFSLNLQMFFYVQFFNLTYMTLFSLL